MDGKPLLVHHGVVHPWLCDVLDHLTVRNYLAMFDEAAYHFLLQALGYWPGAAGWKGRSWADVRNVIEYKKELRVGDLVQIVATCTAIGTKTITAFYEMRHAATGELHATFEATSVLFDATARRAMALPDELKDALRVRFGLSP